MTSSSPALGWPALLVLCIAQGLMVFDQTCVGVALPALAPALGFEPASLSWVANGYLIAFGGLSLLGGRLADLFGARRVLIAGFLALAAASLVAGAAPTQAALIAGRAAQGASSALVVPAALALLTTLYGEQPAGLRRALAAWGTASGVGGAAGVLVGAAAIEWSSWRWAFLLVAPIAGGAALGVGALVPATPRRPVSLDLAGALIVVTGTALAIYAIVRARYLGAPATASVVVASIAMLAGFVALERRRRAPLVPLAVFRIPNLASGNLVMGLLGAAYFPLWFFLNIYLHDELGIRGLTSGLLLTPMRLVYLVLSIAATERLVARIGARRALMLGLGSIGAALVLLTVTPAPPTSVTHALVPSLLGAAGMAFAYVPAMMVSTAFVPPHMHGLSSGILGTSYQLGSAIGLATTGAIWSSAGIAPAVMTAAGFALAAVAVASQARRGGAARRRAGRPGRSPGPSAVELGSSARTRRTREA
jgi:MFS family permease